MAAAISNARLPLPRQELTERAGRAVIGLVCFALCYYGTQAIGPAVKAFSPALPIDWRLPCIPAFAWIYAIGVVWPVVIIFRVSTDSIDRSLAAFVLLSVCAAMLFLLFPTDGSALRSQCGQQSEWALRTLARLDKPVNMMPSLHVGYAVLAAICLRDHQRTWRLGALAMAVLQIVASCLTKQHFIADVAAGAALAVISYGLCTLVAFPSASHPWRFRNATMRREMSSSDGSGNVPGAAARAKR